MKKKVQVAMLTAHAPGDRIVSVVNTIERELRALSAARQLSCRQCEARVIYRHGPIRQAHFAHFEASECVGLGDNDGDNPEHRAMKLCLYQWLQESYPAAAVELEAVLETGQRTDLLLTTPKGQRIAIEAEWSAVTVESWRSRHRRYQETNVADIWVLHQRWFSSLTSEPLLHTDPTLRQLGAVVELIRMDEVQRDIKRWMPYVVFLNPLEQTPIVRLIIETKPATTSQFYATTVAVPLNQCQIAHNQLRHPTLDAYLGIDIQEVSATEHRHRPLPTHEYRQDPSSNIEHLGNIGISYRRNKNILNHWLVNRRIELITHPLWQQLCIQYQLSSDVSQLPPVIGILVPAIMKLDIDPHIWQAWIYYTYIYDQSADFALDLASVVNALVSWMNAFIDTPTEISTIVEGYFSALSEIHLLRHIRKPYKNIDGQLHRWLVCRMPSGYEKEFFVRWKMRHEIKSLVGDVSSSLLNIFQHIPLYGQLFNKISQHQDIQKIVQFIMNQTGEKVTREQLRRVGRAVFILGEEEVLFFLDKAKKRALTNQYLTVRGHFFSILSENLDDFQRSFVFIPSSSYPLPDCDTEAQQLGHIISLLGIEYVGVWIESLVVLMEYLRYPALYATAAEAAYFLAYLHNKTQGKNTFTIKDSLLLHLAVSLTEEQIEHLENWPKRGRPHDHFTIEERPSVYKQLLKYIGITMPGQVELRGRPGKIIERANVAIISMQDEQPHHLTEVIGVQMHPTIYTVYIPASKWQDVRDSLINPHTILVIRGGLCFDPEMQGIVVAASHVSSVISFITQS